MKGSKLRADALLVELGLCPSRSLAQAWILAGRMYRGTERVDKPGRALPRDAMVTVRAGPRFVSRGGEKLEGAIEALGVPVSGRTCVDVGASTGGFTDCALAHGARRVYAVDVGRGLLAEKLRNDPRVISREAENARHMRRDSFPEPIELVLVDASFIGVEKLLPAIGEVLSPGGELLAMIKPQFEAGRELARRHRGVIRDATLRGQIVDGVAERILCAGFELVGRCDSVLAGPKGNLEHFVWARRQGSGPRDPEIIEKLRKCLD